MIKIKIPTVYVRGVTYNDFHKLFSLVQADSRLKGFEYNGYSPDARHHYFFILNDKNVYYRRLYGMTHDGSTFLPKMKEITLKELYRILENKRELFKPRQAKSIAIHAEVRAVFL